MIAAYRHHGVDIPQGLTPPELHDIEQYYWVAFWDLTGDRQNGGPIPWLAIWQYFKVEGFGDFYTFQRIIKTMDGVYMKAVESKE